MSGWSIVATMVSALAALVGALVILNLRNLAACIKKIEGRQDKQEKEIKELGASFAACKIDCDRNTVSKEDWVRSQGYTRRGMDQLNGQMATMIGKLEVVNKLPEISSGIARAVVSEMKKKEPS